LDIAHRSIIQIASNAAVWSAVERSITAVKCVPDYLKSKLTPSTTSAHRAALEHLIEETNSAIAFLHDDSQSGLRLLFSYSFVAHSHFEAFIEDFVDDGHSKNGARFTYARLNRPEVNPAPF
jgi:hypothetical protein